MATQNSFYISRLLSEGAAGEYRGVVIARKHTRRYGAEQNCSAVPSAVTEAGGEI